MNMVSEAQFAEMELDKLQAHFDKLESAAIGAAMYLQRREMGQCANELAGQLWAAIDNKGEGE